MIPNEVTDQTLTTDQAIEKITESIDMKLKILKTSEFKLFDRKHLEQEINALSYNLSALREKKYKTLTRYPSLSNKNIQSKEEKEQLYRLIENIGESDAL